MEEVEIDNLGPPPHLNGSVGCKNNIAAKNIIAVVVPNVGMKCVVHQDIVLAGAIEALPQLEPAVEAEIIENVVVAGAIVKVNIPAMIAAPARVRKNSRLHGVEHGEFCLNAMDRRVQINPGDTPPAVPTPGVERSMVASFLHGVENIATVDVGPGPAAISEVDSGTQH